MDASEIRPLFDKHFRPVARQFFILGVILGLLGGFGLGYLVGQDTAESKVIVLTGERHRA